MDSGASSGTAAGALLFKVPATAASGASANNTSTVLTINNVGFVYAGLQNVTDVGAVSLTASKGGSTSGAGGNASLIGGGAGTAGGATGTANLTGGSNAVASGSTAGGQVNITAGSCTGTTSTGGGGATVIAGGTGGTSSGTGGAASLTGGAGLGSTSGVGGLATLAGGAGSTSSNNNASGGVTITTGLGSGSSTSDIALQSGFALASGSSAQSTYDRVRITSKTKALSTTTNNPTVIANLSNAVTDSGVGAVIDGVIELIDGSHHVGSVTFTAVYTGVNQNGIVTAAASTAGTGNLAAQTGGTYTALTTTWDTAISGTNIQLRVTPTWSAGTPTTARITYQARVSGQGSLSPQ
jgi:hypothetical protein